MVTWHEARARMIDSNSRGLSRGTSTRFHHLLVLRPCHFERIRICRQIRLVLIQLRSVERSGSRPSNRLKHAPARQKRQTKFLYQDTGRGTRGKRQTNLLYQGNCALKSLFSRKDRGAGPAVLDASLLLQLKAPIRRVCYQRQRCMLL